jgi:hypothetical protein
MGKRRVECDNCGATLRRWPSHISEHNFCDRSCHSEWMADHKTGKNHPRYSKELLECDWCGDKVERPKHRAECDQRHFCDLECKGSYYSENPSELHEKDRVTVECSNCGDELERTPHRVEMRDNHFCDAECKGEWWSENYKGDDHPNWKGGHDPYYGENWQEQRRKARRRDMYQCFFCGLSDGSSKVIWGRELDVHHVQRKDSFEDLETANRVGNLLTLCRICHHSTHNDPTLG